MSDTQLDKIRKKHAHAAKHVVAPQDQMFELWRDIRAMRLQEVDAIERVIGKYPRTSELRKAHDKQERESRTNG